MQEKQTVQFAVTTKNGVVTQVGRSTGYTPRTKYSGKKTKWFDESRLLKKGASNGTR